MTFLPGSQPVATVYIDASPTAGAAYFQGDFIYMAWSADLPSLLGALIFVKALAAILLAILRWQAVWRHRPIHIQTDNKAAASTLQSGRTRCPVANNILKAILWTAAVSQVTLSISYISTKDNYIADALSRMDNSKFLAMAIKFFASVGVYISQPSFNLLAHMLPNSLQFL